MWVDGRETNFKANTKNVEQERDYYYYYYYWWWGGEIFCIRLDRSWGPPSLLRVYNGYRVFPGGKAAGAWRDHPPPPGAEVKERVELYLYSPSGPSWPVLG